MKRALVVLFVIVALAILLLTACQAPVERTPTTDKRGRAQPLGEDNLTTAGRPLVQEGSGGGVAVQTK